MKSEFQVDGTTVIRLESEDLRVDVAPGVGGRVISLVDKRTNHEFLWRNANLRLEKLPGGSEYDPNFYGGIDELVPNDIPEIINGINCPDHGELWTTSLDWKTEGETLILRGKLPLFGLTYERQMSLRAGSPHLDFRYRISNPTNQSRQFLWKLHAALAVQPGDVIECPARKAQVIDPAWCRFKTLAPFDWPMIEGKAANIIPTSEGTMDFFYLFDLKSGEVGWRSTDRGLKFAYHFDTKVFPFTWLFASYGGFNGHYTIILEPCTAMPISVNEAAAKRQCSALAPGQVLETAVTIHAGSL